MELNLRSLKSIINNEAKEYALYTVEERAIPNLIDGFKPVQRFIIYRALEKAKGDKSKYHKLAGLSGGVAEIGYHHGEGSAAEAGKLMANNWNNNVPFLDGRGAFGSRLIQKGGAARYVFCRISQNFFDLYKDLNISPEHPDVEHIPPKFYLPIIPTVLLNGVKGIATGYATNILPHSLKSVVECTKLAIDGKLDKEPEVQFPQFNGKIIPTESGVELQGTYELKGKTQLLITEVPYKWEREAYTTKILDELVNQGKISEYDDLSGEDEKTGQVKFRFKISIKKDFNLKSDPEERHEQIIKEFGLSQKIGQFFTVIDDQGKIRDDFTKASELIKYFVEIRKPFYQKRIDIKLSESEYLYDYAKAKVDFIKMVLDKTIVLSGKSRKDALAAIEQFDNLKPFSDKLISMNLYHMTKDEIKKLEQAAKEYKAEYEYWKTTDIETEYKKDIDSINA